MIVTQKTMKELNINDSFKLVFDESNGQLTLFVWDGKDLFWRQFYAMPKDDWSGFATEINAFIASLP